MSAFGLVQGTLNLLVSQPIMVKGDSMLPTLSHRQLVQAVSLRLPWNRVRRGDIVIFRHPQRRNRLFIKRVIGLPGDYVQLADERVLINEQPLREPYLGGASTGSKGKATAWMPDADEYFVLGDNRRDSEDSRDFGLVPRELILQRVWFRHWPPRRFKPQPEPLHG
jgi:signal peptidase I